MGRWARRGPAVVLLGVLMLAHPLLHPFEGGSLDVLMQTLAAWAMIGADE